MAAAQKEYRIKKKKNGRYMVCLKGGKKINGEEKLRVLVEKGLVKAALPKPKAVEEAPAEEAAAEAPAEEAPAEESAE